MTVDGLLWLCLLTSALSLCAGVSCAVVSWRRALPSISLSKKLRELEAEIAECQSSLDSTIASHRRLSSRVGMRSKRGQLLAEGPEQPQGTLPLTKAELRAKYLNGKTPAQVANEAVAGAITPNRSSDA